MGTIVGDYKQILRIHPLRHPEVSPELKVTILDGTYSQGLGELVPLPVYSQYKTST